MRRESAERFVGMRPLGWGILWVYTAYMRADLSGTVGILGGFCQHIYSESYVRIKDCRLWMKIYEGRQGETKGPAKMSAHSPDHSTCQQIPQWSF